MSDYDFIKKFESCSIPKSEWTHRDHVKMAYVYLVKFTLDESVKKIRDGLKKLNKTHGTDDFQFHETLTLAWITIINSTMSRMKPCNDSEDFCIRYPHLLVWNSIYFFYSADLLSSKEARASFLEPDLTDFPTLKRKNPKCN